MKFIITDIGSAKKIQVEGVSQEILDHLFGIGYDHVVVGGDEVEEACQEIQADIDERLK